MSAAGPDPEAAPDPAAPAPGGDGRYPRYVLGVLVLVYVFNFLDRQILSILNEEIQRDLGVSDAEMGFLYGTAFAVFYAVFGIPLGRLADVWVRRSLIAWGLAVWSGMTALSGLARSFGELAAARIGVGVGEASATPAAYSLLSDWFPAARRATVLAIYSSGLYIGAGLGLGVGGLIVERWDAAFGAGAAPFGLRGWQVAFLAVGTPGLLLALWVRTLREPVRGRADGLPAPPEPHPFRAFFRELAAVLPPLTLWNVTRGGGGRALAANLLAAAAIALAALGLVAATGNPRQWIALGLGVYATVSWAQALRHRDAPTAALLLRTPSLRYLAFGFALLSFPGYGLGYWAAPFFVRVHGVELAQVGLVLGGSAAAGGWLGTTLGGLLADRWRRRSPNGRLWVGVLVAVATTPLGVALVSTERLWLAYALTFPLNVFGSMWIGAGASTLQDLMLPRMRATASAAYILLITFVGLALGPFTIGFLSDAFGSLRQGMLAGLSAYGLALAMLLLAARHLPRDERSLRERARAAGEALA